MKNSKINSVTCDYNVYGSYEFEVIWYFEQRLFV